MHCQYSMITYSVYFCCSSLRNVAAKEQYVRLELILWISTCTRFINRVWHNFVDQKLFDTYCKVVISKDYKFISLRSQFLNLIVYMQCSIFPPVFFTRQFEVYLFLHRKCLHNKLFIYACL